MADVSISCALDCTASPLEFYQQFNCISFFSIQRDTFCFMRFISHPDYVFILHDLTYCHIPHLLSYAIHLYISRKHLGQSRKSCACLLQYGRSSDEQRVVYSIAGAKISLFIATTLRFITSTFKFLNPFTSWPAVNVRSFLLVAPDPIKPEL